jgi:drug/metabolite transporter (DMT)-like permease
MKIKSSKSSLFALTTLITLGIVWGTGYSIARFAMLNGVSPLGYGFWQSLGPAIVLGCIAAYRGKLPTPAKNTLTYYLVCGLTGIVIPNTTMYFAAPHLPASILAMVVNTVPIVAYPLALAARLESFNWQRMAGIILALIALMFIILPDSSLPSPEMANWVLLALITPVSFAVCSIFIARFQPANLDSLTLSVGMLSVSSMLLIPLVISTHSFYMFHLPLTMPDGVIILEILLSSLGYLLFFKLIRIAGPVYYSLVDTIVVLTGLFWGHVIFGEHLNQWTSLAVYLILMALLLVTRQQRSAASTKKGNGNEDLLSRIIQSVNLSLMIISIN